MEKNYQHCKTEILSYEIPFELQVETTTMLRIFVVMLCYLSSIKRIRPEKFKPEQDLNPALCDASAVL